MVIKNLANFCFKDRQNSEIIWFVPISTKYEKKKLSYQDYNKKEFIFYLKIKKVIEFK